MQWDSDVSNGGGPVASVWLQLVGLGCLPAGPLVVLTLPHVCSLLAFRGESQSVGAGKGLVAHRCMPRCWGGRVGHHRLGVPARDVLEPLGHVLWVGQLECEVGQALQVVVLLGGEQLQPVRALDVDQKGWGGVPVGKDLR